MKGKTMEKSGERLPVKYKEGIIESPNKTELVKKGNNSNINTVQESQPLMFITRN